MRTNPDILSGKALSFAFAMAKGFHATVGKTSEGKDSVVLVDVAGVWRKFDPLSDTKLIEQLIQAHKLQVYALGFGWSAKQAGDPLSTHAMTKEEAVLRCVTKAICGELVDVPASLLNLCDA